MIETTTGDLVLDELRIGPSQTRRDFLAAASKLDPETMVDNPPWRSYRVVASDRSDQTLAIIVQFEAESLTGMSMASVEAGAGRTWDEWSEDGERERRDGHDAWLRRTSGIPGRGTYPWGTVTSDIDTRAGGAVIRVTYQRGGVD